MELRDRLRRIRPLAAERPVKPRSVGPREEQALERTLEGFRKSGSSGSWFEVRRRFPLDLRQGGVSLRSLGSLQPRAVALLTGASELDFRPEETLFLDTETTGLSWGAGTTVFLVGVGSFTADHFHVRQLFLSDPSSERAFLEALESLLRGEGTSHTPRLLVTFNGKSFDLNVLENRFILCRLPSPLSHLPHLDLLHVGRRLWRNRFEDCTLQTLERRLLKLHRDDDIASSLIPRTYFDYLHHGRIEPFRSVFRHNRQDIVSLALLLGLAGRQVLDPSPEYGVDPVAAARLHILRGRPEGALRILERARIDRHGDTTTVLLALAEMYRRRSRHQEALRLLETLLAEVAQPPVEAFVETAKLLEHQKRDLGRALQVVLSGLKRFGRSEDLRHRRHRLESRLAGRRWY